MRSVFTVMASPPCPHFPTLHLASIPLTVRKLLPEQSLVSVWLSRSQLLGTYPPKSLDSFYCVGLPAPLLTHCPFLTFLWYGPILLHLFLALTTPKEAREVERERNKQVKDWVICVKCSWTLLVVMKEENCILKCIMEVVEKILGVNGSVCWWPVGLLLSREALGRKRKDVQVVIVYSMISCSTPWQRAPGLEQCVSAVPRLQLSKPCDGNSWPEQTWCSLWSLCILLNALHVIECRHLRVFGGRMLPQILLGVH